MAVVAVTEIAAELDDLVPQRRQPPDHPPRRPAAPAVARREFVVLIAIARMEGVPARPASRSGGEAVDHERQRVEGGKAVHGQAAGPQDLEDVAVIARSVGDVLVHHAAEHEVESLRRKPRRGSRDAMSSSSVA